MLSIRKLFSIILIMFVLLALFMFTEVYISSVADYDANSYGGEVNIRRSDSWDSDGDGAVTRQTALIGSPKRGAGNVVSQWCTYAKRLLGCFGSLEEYMQSEDGAKVLCIDPGYLSLPSDEARLMELIGENLTIIFCSLPDVKVVADSPALRMLLGIETVVHERARFTGVCLYDGFLLGGGALYGQDTGMDVELELPWYSLEGGTKVYIAGLTQRAEDSAAILWRNNEGRARIFAVNGDFMEDATGLGLLEGMLAESSSYLLYPVVNTQSLTVADYPSFATENAEELQNVYASTHRLLLQNIIWQSLIAISEQSRFRLTCFLTTQLRDAEEAPHTEDLEYYIRQLGRAKGEAGRSADGSGADSPMGQWERDNAFFSESGSGYIYTAAYAGEDATGFLKIVESGGAQDIRTVVSEDNAPLLSFLTEDITCQGITHHADQYGFREDLKNRSIQTALAYTNILLDLRRVTWPESEKDHWQNYSPELLGNLETWWKPYSCFNKTTVTESDLALRKFFTLDYEDQREADVITLEVSGREDTVSFLLRTHDRDVRSVSGGTVVKLEKDIWLLSVQDDTVRIELGRVLP